MQLTYARLQFRLKSDLPMIGIRGTRVVSGIATTRQVPETQVGPRLLRNVPRGQ